MARWKPKKPGSPTAPSRKITADSTEPRLSSKLRRHYKEKARREKLLRQKKPKLRDYLLNWGCAVLVLAVLAFTGALTYACFVRE